MREKIYRAGSICPFQDISNLSRAQGDGKVAALSFTKWLETNPVQRGTTDKTAEQPAQSRAYRNVCHADW